MNRLTNKGKRDKIKGIGGEKGQCVHNSRSAKKNYRLKHNSDPHD